MWKQSAKGTSVRACRECHRLAANRRYAEAKAASASARCVSPTMYEIVQNGEVVATTVSLGRGGWVLLNADEMLTDERFPSPAAAARGFRLANAPRRA